MSQFFPIPFGIAAALAAGMIITETGAATNQIVIAIVAAVVGVVVGAAWVASPLPNGTGFVSPAGEQDE